jgi:hypothetical protein
VANRLRLEVAKCTTSNAELIKLLKKNEGLYVLKVLAAAVVTLARFFLLLPHGREKKTHQLMSREERSAILILF